MSVVGTIYGTYDNTIYSATSIPRDFGLFKVSTYNNLGGDSYMPAILNSLITDFHGNNCSS